MRHLLLFIFITAFGIQWSIANDSTRTVFYVGTGEMLYRNSMALPMGAGGLSSHLSYSKEKQNLNTLKTFNIKVEYASLRRNKVPLWENFHVFDLEIKRSYFKQIQHIKSNNIFVHGGLSGAFSSHAAISGHVLKDTYNIHYTVNSNMNIGPSALVKYRWNNFLITYQLDMPLIFFGYYPKHNYILEKQKDLAIFFNRIKARTFINNFFLYHSISLEKQLVSNENWKTKIKLRYIHNFHRGEYYTEETAFRKNQILIGVILNKK